jgi:hypothetical protein
MRDHLARQPLADQPRHRAQLGPRRRHPSGLVIVVGGALLLHAHEQTFGDRPDAVPTNPSPIRTALRCQAVAVRISRPSLIIHRASLSVSSTSPNALNLTALEQHKNATDYYEIACRV